MITDDDNDDADDNEDVDNGDDYKDHTSQGFSSINILGKCCCDPHFTVGRGGGGAEAQRG